MDRSGYNIVFTLLLHFQQYQKEHYNAVQYYNIVFLYKFCKNIIFRVFYTLRCNSLNNIRKILYNSKKHHIILFLFSIILDKHHNIMFLYYVIVFFGYC